MSLSIYIRITNYVKIIKISLKQEKFENNSAQVELLSNLNHKTFMCLVNNYLNNFQLF